MHAWYMQYYIYMHNHMYICACMLFSGHYCYSDLVLVYVVRVVYTGHYNHKYKFT